MTHDDWGNELDEYGSIKDPVARYREFLIEFNYMALEAGDVGYSPDALRALAEAQRLFEDDFKARHPGQSLTR